MTEQQWKNLIDIVNGKVCDPLPAGFIIDCPWLPNWYGTSILDYFTSDELWFQSNLKAMETFPDIMFLPGFWSEYGMCSEPSAFGAKTSFPENQFPHAQKCIHSLKEIDTIKKPKAGVDGLGPFLLNRLKLNRKRIEEAGHSICFSVSRGHLNIASYLMGTTELMTGLLMDPARIHTLLRIITDYLKEWHDLQRKTFPSIDGILILDDLVGFIGEEEFKQFGLPYLKELYNTDVNIKFFHNDADWKSCINYLPEIGINLFNMAFNTSLNELKNLTANKVTMLGNIPPRDVLAQGTPDDVKKAVVIMINELDDPGHFIVSCGGGMPPGVSTENITSVTQGIREAAAGR
jgi:uroporphyrinogen-III decarboxylase